MLEPETGSEPFQSGTDPEGGAVTLIGPFRATFGGGVIGNTAGSGPVVGGSSPPPRARGGVRCRRYTDRRSDDPDQRIGHVGDGACPVRLEA